MDKEDFWDTNLVGWVKMKVREGKEMEVIDRQLLCGSVNKDDEEEAREQVKEMVRYLEITLQCVDDFPSKRPNMLQVVPMLRELASGGAAATVLDQFILINYHISSKKLLGRNTSNKLNASIYI
ncbi:BRI1-like 2 [Perilla frutescens var. hirtella]|nr:BRI1-like 2 [Perilla frutescens var. frutescens]KAH6792983.1 BRI1-like 2 [Perilla frutescens var. hirtella]